MANELAVIPTPNAMAVQRPSELLQPNNLGELQQLGQLMAASGFFSDSRQAASACVKILAGREMGFPPIASMVGISIISGKPVLGSNLIAAAMKRAGYTWEMHQRDARGCKLTIFHNGKRQGPSEFLEEDAKAAGLLGKDNWKKFPRSMYFARAISDAARTYAPEIFSGVTPYTAEEMGEERTMEDGAPLAQHEPQQPAAHGRGPRLAESDAVAQQKIEELRKQQGSQPAQSHTQAADNGAGTQQAQAGAPAPVQNGTKPVPEAVLTMWKQASKGFSECVEVFADLKYQLTEAHGAEAGEMIYRECLNSNGLERGNDLKGKKASQWKSAMLQMYEALTAAPKAAAEPEFDTTEDPEEAAARAFAEGANG